MNSGKSLNHEPSRFNQFLCASVQAEEKWLNFIYAVQPLPIHKIWSLSDTKVLKGTVSAISRGFPSKDGNLIFTTVCFVKLFKFH